MSLKNLVLTTKVAEVDFPGLEGFKLKIAAMSREASRKLKESSEISKIDAKMRMPVKELDEVKFIDGFAQAAIKGWTGLKYKYLPELMLVDLASIENLESEVEYNQENAVMLLSHSAIFDAWINDQVFSLDNFRK
jgi:hypothetical protein